MPKVLGLSLKAHEGMVRWAPTFARIVAQAGFLLMPVQREHRGVQIEQHPPQGVWALAQLGEQAIMQAAQFGQGAQGEAAEESTERRGIGIGRQAGERLEDAVMPQEFRGLDAPQA